MTDKQILFAIENFPGSLPDGLNIICDIYSLDWIHAATLLENKHGPFCFI